MSNKCFILRRSSGIKKSKWNGFTPKNARKSSKCNDGTKTNRRYCILTYCTQCTINFLNRIWNSFLRTHKKVFWGNCWQKTGTKNAKKRNNKQAHWQKNRQQKTGNVLHRQQKTGTWCTVCFNLYTFYF